MLDPCLLTARTVSTSLTHATCPRREGENHREAWSSAEHFINTSNPHTQMWFWLWKGKHVWYHMFLSSWIHMTLDGV